MSSFLENDLEVYWNIPMIDEYIHDQDTELLNITNFLNIQLTKEDLILEIIHCILIK
jgi:hypothetical protein